MTLNTYGQKPDFKRWKLFEVEGWQLLITLQETEEDDGRWEICFSFVPELTGAPAVMKISASTLETTQKIFDGIDDPHKALQGLLDHMGPILQKMEEQNPLED